MLKQVFRLIFILFFGCLQLKGHSEQEAVSDQNLKKGVSRNQSIAYAGSLGTYYGVEAGLWTAFLLSPAIGIPIAEFFVLGGLFGLGAHSVSCHEACHVDKGAQFGKNAYKIFTSSTKDNILENLHRENVKGNRNGSQCILNCTHVQSHIEFMDRFIENFKSDDCEIADKAKDNDAIEILTSFLSSTHALFAHFSKIKELKDRKEDDDLDAPQEIKIDGNIVNSLLYKILRADLKKKNQEEDFVNPRFKSVISKLRENYCSDLCKVYKRYNEQPENVKQKRKFKRAFIKVTKAIRKVCLAAQQACLESSN